uniref:Uncharacterized protein n=1 Tax=Rangifer tarandus platyrhynchus TaxID=3082113 RepID=A0ACB0F9X8_RANTA|nr:unnamed protein product [Rangifer tarandus platyrhynchus]
MLVGEEVTSGALQPEGGAAPEDILGLNPRHSLAPSTSMGTMGGPKCQLSIWNPFATLILTPSALTGLLQDKEHVTESLSSLLPAAVAAAPQPPPDPRPTPKNWYISLEKQPGLAEVPSHRNCRHPHRRARADAHAHPKARPRRPFPHAVSGLLSPRSQERKGLTCGALACHVSCTSVTRPPERVVSQVFACWSSHATPALSRPGMLIYLAPSPDFSKCVRPSDGEGWVRGDRRERGGVPTRGILIPWLEMPEPQQLLPQNSAPAPAAGDLRSFENTGVPVRPSDPSAMPASPQTPAPSSRLLDSGRGAPSFSRLLLPPAGGSVHRSIGWMEDLSPGGPGLASLLSEARRAGCAVDGHRRYQCNVSDSG